MQKPIMEEDNLKKYQKPNDSNSTAGKFVSSDFESHQTFNANKNNSPQKIGKGN